MHAEGKPFIDFDGLRRHVADYDSLFLKLLQLFLEQAPLWIDELNEAFASGDAVLVRQVCHKIKGGAGTLQASAIIEAAADLGRLAAADDLALAEAGRVRLLAMIEQTVAFVRQSEYFRDAF